MGQVVTIDLDLAKSVFKAHGVAEAGRGGGAAQAAALAAPGVLRQTAGLPGGHGGVRLLAPLGPGADRARPPSEADPSAVREALDQAQQEISLPAGKLQLGAWA